MAIALLDSQRHDLVNAAMSEFGELLLVSAGAVVGALSALGGRLWHDAPRSRRLTAQGWLLLICLGLPLPVSVARQQQVERQDADAARQKRELETKITGLEERLAAVRESSLRCNSMQAELRALVSPLSEAIKELRSRGRTRDQNRAPLIEGPTYIAARPGERVEFALAVTDADGSPDENGRIVSLKEELPPGASFDRRVGLFRWTAAAPGLYGTRFEASDTVASTIHEVAIEVLE